MACEPQFETRSIIVQGYSQRGIITDTKLLNPCPSPTVFPNYVGNYCPADNQGFNWYTSCLPFGITSERYETTSLSQIEAIHVEGPSLGEGQATPRNYIHLIGYTGSAQASEETGIPYLPGITQGCSLTANGGPITGVRVVQQGARLGTANPAFVVSGGGSGTNATFNISVSGGTLNGVSVQNGGQDYKVGDTFEVTSTGNFSPPQRGSFEVTSIGTSSNGVSGPARINWWIVDPNLVGNEFGGPGNYLYPTDGYAIGDIFEIQVPGENSKNTNARIEVTAIDPTNLEESQNTLQFTVEKDVDLIYNITSMNRTVDLVRDYDQTSTTDEVLLESCSEVFRVWLDNLSRLPTALEFEYYVKQIYTNGGLVGPEIAELFSNQFQEELDNNVVQVRSGCDSPAEDPIPGGSACAWNRDDFYQGSNTSAARNIQLKELWVHLGQPNGPSGPDGGSTLEDLVCPKPEDGQIADQEPDMSDFAGMKLWRWMPCNDGSNNGNAKLGGYKEIIVPCPGPEEGCVDPIVEDNLAVYNQSSTVYWNNGTKKLGNFVISTKNAQAEAINNQYLTLLGRPAEQVGMVYWNDTANRTISDQYAVYWEYGYVKWQDNSDSFTPLVKTPKSANGIAINNKYLDIFGRPADIAGFGYWVDESNSIGIEKTLENIDIAAVPELSRGPIVVLQYGLSRTLQLIADATPAELSRGGVSEIKKFCQQQVSSNVNLEFFLDTRLPPRYGTIGVNPPDISPVQLADSIYFNYSPASQTDTSRGFTDANATQFKDDLNQRFTVNWSSFTGDPGNLLPPILVKYIKVTLYQSKDGASGPVTKNGGLNTEAFDLALELVNYSDDRLEPIVGPKKLVGTTTPYGGSLENNSTFNDVSAFLSYAGMAPGISLLDAEKLSFNENPHQGRKFFFRLEAVSYALDPETLEEIPSLTRSDISLTDTDTQTMRYFGAWGTDPGPICPKGTKICPDGSVVCVEDDCGGNNGGDCNSLSISCGGNNNLSVETNQATKISFSYRVNGANNCDTKGSAKVSIRRYWPCPVFGPPSGRENQWVIQKQAVPIVNGEAVYDLSVNTSKDDYLSTSYGDQTVDNPGSCHWVYVAYWEINGMSGTSISCNTNAWDNPGCDNGTVFNKLDEILCVQKQACNGDTSCSEDCPTCEQSIKVTIGDTTSCGALDFPQMREDASLYSCSNCDPSINNGRFEVGSTVISTPGTPFTIDKETAKVFTRQVDGKKTLAVLLEYWVSIAPAKVNTLTTLGKNNAVDFNEDDSVNCNAQMRVVAQWYYKRKYKNGSETGILPLPQWDNFDTPDEKQVYKIDTDYYPVSAGNGTNGTPMEYNQEVANGSHYDGFEFAYLPADDSIDTTTLYLQIKASNDKFGDPVYRNPPAGFNERDFGTDTTILSPRFPWNLGTSSPGPKDTIFEVGSYRLGSNANLPTAEWNMSISGCADAQVYENIPGAFGTKVCGDTESDNYYIATSNGTFWQEEGKANGVSFSSGYPATPVCSAPLNFNPNTGQGSDSPRGPFCPQSYFSSGFEDCIPKSDVILSVNEPSSIDWGDYNVGGCTTGIKLMWYIDGECKSKGHINASTGDGGLYRTWSDLSCGERFEDLSIHMTDPNKTYTVTAYAVVNNINGIAYKPVNRDWTVQNGDPYAFSDPSAWQVERGSYRTPINITEDIVIPDGAAWNVGDVFQVILASATCTVKGNNGSSENDLTGLQKPEFTISSSGETWQNLGGLEDFEGGVIDCNPPCCDNSNSGNQCAELQGTLISNSCGPLLCAASGGGAGKLTATVQNLPAAWPRIPGTQTRVTGTVRYLWEYKSNANNWVAVDGGTGSVISYVADGRQYRCKVTFDLAGKEPDGYTANPKSTSTTKIFTTENIDTEVCPDGTVVQIGFPCPDDPGNCDQPERVNGQLPPVFLPAAGQSTTISAKNGESVQVSYLPNFNNFSNVVFVPSGSRAVLKYNNFDVQSSGSALGMFGSGDTRVFGGSGTVTGSNITRTYTASFTIRYKCSLSATQVKTTYVDIPNAVTITWSQGGGEDNGYPKLITPPACFYSSGFLNSSRCGSYLGQWQDTPTSAFTYYFHEKKNDISIDNRGVQYSASAVASNASCTFCPSTTCPSVTINRVVVNPNPPKVNQSGTLQIDYNWVGNGFSEITNPFLNNGLYEQITWTGPGLSSTSGPQVNIGPFTTPGKRTYTVTIAKFYDDPGQQCCIDNGSFKICGIANDTFDFTIDVGGDGGPDDPDPVGKEPVMTGTITGDSTLTLSNGRVTGNYKMSYDLYEGEGYRISDRDITVKWDDLDAIFDKYDYSRTFTTAGTYVITARIAKLFAKPGWEGSVAGAGTIPKEYQKYAYDDVNFNVKVEPEPSNDVAPTSIMTVTQTSGVSTMPLVDGKVTINFACQAIFSNGTAVPTPAPTALRYNTINGSNTGSTLVSGPTTASWSRTFTKAGTYVIGARFRKNYCADGLTTCTDSTPGKTFTLAEDSVRVTITNPQPTGTKPKATIQPITYSNTVNGCGLGITNSPVTATVTINLTQGTGDYVWDNASASGYVRNGNKLVKTLSYARAGDYDLNESTTVTFTKAGKVVNTDASGTATGCVTVVNLNIIPF